MRTRGCAMGGVRVDGGVGPSQLPLPTPTHPSRVLPVAKVSSIASPAPRLGSYRNPPHIPGWRPTSLGGDPHRLPSVCMSVLTCPSRKNICPPSPGGATPGFRAPRPHSRSTLPGWSGRCSSSPRTHSTGGQGRPPGRDREAASSLWQLGRGWDGGKEGVLRCRPSGAK